MRDHYLKHLTTLLVFLFSVISLNAQIAFEEVLPSVQENFHDVYNGSIAFADVDGDNDLDVLVTGVNSTGTRIAELHINDGSGGYTLVGGTPFEGVQNSDVAFADVDGDSDQDVLISGLNSSGLGSTKLYVNDGSGGFTEVVGTPFANVQSASIAFADVDADSDQDVLIMGNDNSDQRVTTLYTNDGSGGFTEVTASFDSVRNGELAFADIDGDTDQDVFITGINSSNQPTSKLYTNNGSGVYTEVTGTPFDAVQDSSIAFADVDGDNDQDILLTGINSSSSRISKLYTNNGSGSFTEVVGTPFEGLVGGLTVFADIDGDNDQDVVINGYGVSNQYITKLYANNGSGVYTEVVSTPFVATQSTAIAFADIDDDNDLDVLISGRDSANQYITTLYINDGAGGYVVASEFLFEDVNNGSIAFADIDGDNDQDVLITGYNGSTGVSKLYANNGSGVFTEVVGTPFESVYASSVAFADVDGDNDQDVLITGYAGIGSGRISKLYTNNGSGVYTEVTGTPFDAVQDSSIAFADIDGDNDQDILLTGLNGSGSRISKLYTNNGFGVFSEVVGTPFVDVQFSSVAFADIDGDNDQDVLITGYTGIVSRGISILYTNNGSGVYTGVTGTPFDAVHQGSIAFADVDGDNDQDILLTGLNGSGSRISKLYTNNGFGVFSEVVGTPFEVVYRSSVAFADIDGDNDQDILITGNNGSGGISKLYTNNGSGVFTEIIGTPFEGVQSSSIAFADIDGDNDQDVLITGYNNGFTGVSKLYFNNTIPITPDQATLPDITAQCESTPTAPTANSGTITATPDVAFPIATQGTTVVTWDYGGGATQTQNVIIDDTTAPSLTCDPVMADADSGACEATLTINPPIVTDNCNYGNALDFDGVDDSVTMSPTGMANTIEFWMHTDIPIDGNTQTMLISSFNNSNANYIIANNFSSSFTGETISLNVGFSGSIRTNVPLSSGWNHIAITSNGSMYSKIYLNGVEAASTIFGTPSVFNLSTMMMGIAPSQTAFYDGKLDEFRVWDYSRSQEGIQAQMNNEITVQPGLIAYYNFNEGTALQDNSTETIISDASVNGADGTLNNFALVGCESNFVAGFNGITVTNDITGTCDASGTYPVGDTDIIWTATDANGNTNTCTQTVTVEDTENPIVSVQNIGVTLDASGQANITPQSIDNGSTDNCGVASLILDKSSFDCNDIDTGENNYALDFDGADDYVVAPHNVSTTLNSFTVEAWISTTQSSPYARIITKPVNGGQNYSLLLNNGKPHIRYDEAAGTGKHVEGTVSINDGQWHHLAGVYYSITNTLELFVDGISVGTTITSGTPVTGNEGLFIGRFSSLYDGYFNGKIDEVRVWNVNRSDSQINEFMNKSLVGDELGLVAYFDFNEGTSTVANDKSDNANNGTLTNMDEATDWASDAPNIINGIPVVLTVTDVNGNQSTATASVTVVEPADADGDGYKICDGDCDDTNANVYPGAQEVSDGLDNDCNGQIDDNTCELIGVSVTTTNATCADTEDGGAQIEITFYGAPVAIEGNLGGPDWFPLGTPTSNPFVLPVNVMAGTYTVTVREANNNSCEESFEFTVGVNSNPPDMDGDGYTVCDGDCDDNDAAINPGAAEVCDGVDNNCDGSIDESGGQLWYVDNDGDGFGDANDAGVLSCFQLPGTSDNNSDCDDSLDNVYPGAQEVCDGIDNNCDGNGSIDEGFDMDQDGFTTCAGDCDDTDDTVFPGSREINCDGVDNDCNPSTPDNQNPAVVDVSVTTEVGIGPVMSLDFSTDFINGTDFDFNAIGTGVSDPGGMIWQFSNMDPSTYGGLWWNFFEIKNPRHSSQPETGFMQFTNYNPATGIAVWTSTAPMTWTTPGFPQQSVNTQFRMQLQPLGATGASPLAPGALGNTVANTVFASDISMNTVPSSFPVMDVKAQGDFQAWFAFEVAGTNQPLATFYDNANTPPNSEFRTSVSSRFSKADPKCVNPGSVLAMSATADASNPAPFVYTYNGVSNTTGIFPSIGAGTYNWSVTASDGCLTEGMHTVNPPNTNNTTPIPDVANLPDITAECEVTSLTPPTATGECGNSVTGSHDATLPITTQGTTVVTWTYDAGNGYTATQTQNVVIGPSFNLWGMTRSGGITANAGGIFEYDIETEILTHHYYFDSANNNGFNPQEDLLPASNGKLYGTTDAGGANNLGTLFEFDPISHLFTKKIDFDGTNGSNANGSLIQLADGKIYGTTRGGGNLNKGVIFVYDPVTNILTKLFDFGGLNGELPFGNFVHYRNGVLLGLAFNGGSQGMGVLFRFDTNNNSYTKLIDFTGTNGAYPRGSLIKANNGKFYGTTQGGGLNNKGTIFEFDPMSGFTKKADFDGTNTGSDPWGDLIQAPNGKFYGTNLLGGANNKGVIYVYDGVSAIGKLIDFNGINGESPRGNLVAIDNRTILGMTLSGGTSSMGNLFELDLTTNTLTNKVNFAGGATGAIPISGLIKVNSAPEIILDLAQLPDVESECEVTALTPPTATGNCGEIITITHDADLPITSQGTTVVTWTYDDGNGNTATQTQNVVIADVTPPTINCGSPVMLSVDSGQCSATIFDDSYDIIGTDNCDGATTVNDYTSTSTLNGATFNLGETLVEWTVTDAVGNTVSCTQSITVEDDEAPLASCQDIAVQLDANGEATITPEDIDNGSSDNCGIQLITIDINAFDCNDSGTIAPVTLTVKDDAGNETTCTANVTVSPPADQDGDGFTICDGDCNDNDPLINPTTVWYADVDGDGYGDPNTSEVACVPTLTNATSDNSDCNDTDASINPSATEICDGIDNNCDGNIDEGVTTTYYADADGDSYGDPNTSMEACSLPAGYVLDNTDCDDTNASVNPVAQEVCDGIDNDCDGLIDDNDDSVTGQSVWYADTDGDSYGDPNSSTLSCIQPLGFVADNSDCDDTDINIFAVLDDPIISGETTICDGDTASLMATNTGGTTSWYSDSGGTALISTGTSFVTPALTADTTYYVREVAGGTCSSNLVSITVQVNPLPVVTFTAPDDICINADLLTGLGGGLPTGGVYSGPGVTDDGNGMTYTFDPAVAGAGTASISYTIGNSLYLVLRNTSSGISNALFKYSDNYITQVALPSDYIMEEHTDIKVFNNELYVVLRNSSSNGVLFKFDGTAFTQVTLPVGLRVSRYFDFEMYNGEFYMVLEDNSGDYFYKYDGSTFTQIPLPGSLKNGGGSRFVKYNSQIFNNELFLVLEDGSNGIYGALYKYNGSSFTEIMLPSGLRMAPRDHEMEVFGGELFVVLEDGSNGIYGALYKYDGTSFTQITLPSGMRMGDYYPSEQDNGELFVVLEDGSNGIYGALYKYDGSAFSSITLPSGFRMANNYDMAVVENDLIVILENGLGGIYGSPYKYDGTALTNISLPSGFRVQRDFKMQYFGTSCFNFVNDEIEVFDSPTITATASATEICEGESVTLTSDGAISYIWDNNVTDGQAFVPTETTTYTVIGTDANGCENTAEVTITVNPLPAPVISGPTDYCIEAGVTLDAGPGFASYLWSPGGETTQTISALEGSYTVTVTNDFGCSATSDSFDVIDSDSEAPILESVTPDTGAYCLLGNSFVWTVDASDENLFSLEVDHSLEGTVPEFTVYASASDPYGGNEADFTALGAVVTYDDVLQQWTIDFGETVTDLFIANGGITLYAVLKDCAGNELGSMSPTTPENTFAYTFDNDNEAPVLEAVTPDTGAYCLLGNSFVWTVDASDANLYSLEIDHSLEGTLPEFTVYASSSDPYGGNEADFTALGALVTYDEVLQQWTIDFGETVTDLFIANGGITLYAVLKDCAGNELGSMSPTTPENTFVYTFDNDNEAPLLEAVTPNTGINCLADNNFIWTVDASDANLYSLEVDHSLEGTIPEFTVYASASDPYGGNEADFTALGALVTYDDVLQQWTIDFGETVTDLFKTNGGITLYAVLKDCAGNELGSMSPATPENTFTYTFPVPPIVEISGSSEYCEGAGGVTLDAGAGFGSYLWSPGGQTTQTISGALAGVYSVTVTDAVSGCSATSSEFTVIENALPFVSFTAPADLCLTDGVQVSLGGGSPMGGTYSGAGVTDDGNGETYSFDPVAAGEGTHNITYTYEDSNGCTNLATDDIEVIDCFICPQFTGLGSPTNIFTYCEGQQDPFNSFFIDSDVVDVEFRLFTNPTTDPYTGGTVLGTPITPILSPLRAKVELDGIGPGTYYVYAILDEDDPDLTDPLCRPFEFFELRVRPLMTWYADTDGDSYGDPNNSIEDCDQPSGFVADSSDCDDTDASVNTPQLYYVDFDGDGYGSTAEEFICSSTPPAGYADNNTDCNDTDASVNTEQLYYVDFDGDGFGSTAEEFICSSTAPAGYADNNTDCNDTDASVNTPQLYYVDFDGDGYGSTAEEFICSSTPPAGYADNNTDCDDTDASVNTPQLYYVDFDGDGFGSTAEEFICSSTAPAGYADNNTDCDDTDASVNTPQLYYVDFDGDGFGSTAEEFICSSNVPAGYADNNTDCDDTDASVNTPQLYYVDFDGDGFGSTAEEFICSSTAPAGYADNNTDCDDTDASVNTPQLYYVDFDGDGFGSTAEEFICSSTAPAGYADNNTDCDDNDASVNTPQLYYVDFDGDGFGSTAEEFICSSTVPAGYADNNTDCDDTDASVNTPQLYYVDFDGDGFGSTAEEFICSSTAPAGYADNNTDCDDTDASVNTPQLYYVDFDGDGFGST
ncbi:VCBS repeat-containing protein, partial [Hyunsoonleella sp. SJ7]